MTQFNHKPSVGLSKLIYEGFSSVEKDLQNSDSDFLVEIRSYLEQKYVLDYLYAQLIVLVLRLFHNGGILKLWYFWGRFL